MMTDLMGTPPFEWMDHAAGVFHRIQRMETILMIIGYLAFLLLFHQALRKQASIHEWHSVDPRPQEGYTPSHADKTLPTISETANIINCQTTIKEGDADKSDTSERMDMLQWGSEGYLIGQGTKKGDANLCSEEKLDTFSASFFPTQRALQGIETLLA